MEDPWVLCLVGWLTRTQQWPGNSNGVRTRSRRMMVDFCWEFQAINHSRGSFYDTDPWPRHFSQPKWRNFPQNYYTHICMWICGITNLYVFFKRISDQSTVSRGNPSKLPIHLHCLISAQWVPSYVRPCHIHTNSQNKRLNKPSTSTWMAKDWNEPHKKKVWHSIILVGW